LRNQGLCFHNTPSIAAAAAAADDDGDDDEHDGVQEDVAERPFVSRVINKLAHYQGGIVPNVEQDSPADEPPPVDSPQVAAGGATVKKKKKKKKAEPKKASDSFSEYACLRLQYMLLTDE